MKNFLTIPVFLLISTFIFTQRIASKKFESVATEISISTDGLDDFVLENATSNFIEVYLYAENAAEKHIILEETATLVNLQFNIPFLQTKENVFRKFITKRLQRASAVIKVPKNIKVAIFGDNINITSKNFDGNLRIFIEKGIVKLNTIQQNVTLKMYAGNVYGEALNANVNLISNIGKIKIDDHYFQKKYTKKNGLSSQKIKITTIKGNIFFTSQ
ncbi:MAG: hypothetical protein ACWIPJ_01890 [Polaribacter sp.]